MGHHHHHGHSHHHASHNKNGILMAFLLNFGFAIIEFVGGILFNSTAILSDALHDMGDALVLLLSLILDKQSRKPANSKYSYGYKRLAVIGAIFNSLLLLSGTIWMIKEELQSVMHPEPVHATGMFGMAIFGILVNGRSLFALKGSQNILERSVFVHLLEDVLGWVAVLVASIIIYFTQWYFIDGVLAFTISGIILWNVWRNLRTIYNIIMHVTPLDTLSSFEKNILQLDGVKHIEQSHLWSLDGHSHVYTARLHVIPSHALTIRKHIEQIAHDYHIEDITIEFVG